MEVTERMNRRYKRRKRIVRLGIGLLVLAAILLTVFLFQVKTIKVSGNQNHTQQEISSDLVDGVPVANTFYLAWKYRNGAVPDNMPYLEELQVEIASPFTLQVTVKEKEIVGYIDQGNYVYFDREGTVLEISDQVKEGIPVVTGASIGDAALYQRLPAESSAQLRTILSLLQLLSDQGLEASEIRFGDNMDMTVYIGGVEALLGQDEYLEEKVANLKAILDAMGGQQGTLHLESFTGRGEEVPFSASDEPATESSSESEGTGETGAGTSETAGSEGAAGAQTDETGGDGAAGTQTDETVGETAAPQSEQTEAASTTFMVFNAYGTLVYDAHVVNGAVVDSTGTPIEGVTVNEDGNVVDAYMNVIDPATGQLAQ